MGFEQKYEGVNVIKQANPEDLIKFGLIPEFVGRLPVIAHLDKLTTQDLVRILVEPKNSLVKQYETLFKIDGIDFSVDKKALNLIADKAIELKSGARGLRNIFEKAMLETMYNSPNDKSIKKILLSIDSTNNNLENLIIKNETNQTISLS